MTATTTERTSKRLKGWLVVYVVILCIGLAGTYVAVVDDVPPHWIWVALLAAGILGGIGTKIFIWWEHE